MAKKIRKKSAKSLPVLKGKASFDDLVSLSVSGTKVSKSGNNPTPKTPKTGSK